MKRFAVLGALSVCAALLGAPAVAYAAGEVPTSGEKQASVSVAVEVETDLSTDAPNPNGASSTPIVPKEDVQAPSDNAGGVSGDSSEDSDGVVKPDLDGEEGDGSGVLPPDQGGAVPPSADNGDSELNDGVSDGGNAGASEDPKSDLQKPGAGVSAGDKDGALPAEKPHEKAPSSKGDSSVNATQGAVKPSSGQQSAAPAAPKATYEKIQDGAYIIKTPWGKALEIAGAATDNGGNAQTYANNYSAAQRFYISAAGQSKSGEWFYTIKNTNSGKLLDVAGAGKANGTNV